MEIDNHILSLSMEFEKQNIIVTEWETEKAKNKSDRYKWILSNKQIEIMYKTISEYMRNEKRER